MITDRIAFVNNHSLFLGAMLGVLIGMGIREEEDLDNFLSKAYATYPRDPGYTAVIKSLDNVTFDKIVDTVISYGSNNPLNHLVVLESALAFGGPSAFSEMVQALYLGVTTKQLENQLIH